MRTTISNQEAEQSRQSGERAIGWKPQSGLQYHESCSLDIHSGYQPTSMAGFNTAKQSKYVQQRENNQITDLNVWMQHSRNCQATNTDVEGFRPQI